MLTPAAAFSIGDLLAPPVLPAVVLSIGYAALDHALHARLAARGAERRTTSAPPAPRASASSGSITKHALRNALLPVVTLIGSTIGLAVGGAIFIESVFNWPGMGLLLVNAVETRDYPVIMGATLVIGAGVIVVNILTDLVYAEIDPRIKVA